MDKIQYVINNKTLEFSIEGSPAFHYGVSERLSNADTDITYNQRWYDKGYTVENFLNENEFKQLLSGLTDSIKEIISSETGKDVQNFKLNQYHKFITSDETHYKIVSITRDLYPKNFNFPLIDIIPKLEKLLGFELTDVNPDDGNRMHIIVRINRPGSTDFNPPHKDIYVNYDQKEMIPKYVNIWVLICGVTQNSSLPLVPSSHLLTEDKILRTHEGGIIEGNQYRVRTVKEWDGDNHLIRPQIDYGDVLLFTPYLIHGSAINEEDQTRVSLEFRLFKKN